jgi:hypothetical protein
MKEIPNNNKQTTNKSKIFNFQKFKQELFGFGNLIFIFGIYLLFDFLDLVL